MGTGQKGIVTRLLDLFGRRQAVSAASAEQAGEPFAAVVVTFPAPDGAPWGEQVAMALEGRGAISVVRASAIESDGPATVIRLRQMLAETGGDVAVWNEGSDRSLRLRWLAASYPDEDRPGGFGANVRLETPLPLDRGLADLVFAATLAAIRPVDEERLRLHGRLLDTAAGLAAVAGETPPFFAEPRQQATIRLCFGHVAAAAAMAGNDPTGWLKRAVAAYGRGLEGLPPDDLPPVEEATAQRRLATALVALAERTEDDIACLRQAVTAFCAAAEILPRAMMPGEWAAEQMRLGTALYRLDQRTGDASLLRDAIGAFQSASQVFTRVETPLRWAEAMHGLAQTLQVYGDQSRNPDILRKAVDACRAALDVRTQESDQGGWAATLNTLGSALFLLDKHGDDSSHLDEAASLLRTAATTFHDLGATKPALVAERNLAHVERLSRQRRDRPAAPPGWADEPAPAAEPPAEER